jgi:hypothetical protein
VGDVQRMEPIPRCELVVDAEDTPQGRKHGR